MYMYQNYLFGPYDAVNESKDEVDNSGCYHLAQGITETRSEGRGDEIYIKYCIECTCTYVQDVSLGLSDTPTTSLCTKSRVFNYGVNVLRHCTYCPE